MFGNKSLEKSESLADQAEPLLDRATEQVNALLHSSAESVRDTSRQLREKAIQASRCSVNYVKDEPVKAVLIAAATGAVLMALISLVSHARDRR